MTVTAGASSARLPDDMPDDPFLNDEAIHRLTASTAEMPVIRPVPRPEHLAHPDSPVGHTNDESPVDPLAELLVRPLDRWSDVQLHALTDRLLAVRHARRAQLLALAPPTGRHRRRA